MEAKDYKIVFEKLSESQVQQDSIRELVVEGDEIAKLRKIVLEVTEQDYKFLTTT